MALILRRAKLPVILVANKVDNSAEYYQACLLYTSGVGGYVPDYILNNEELSRMVDTTDEWITTRVGIKEMCIRDRP